LKSGTYEWAEKIVSFTGTDIQLLRTDQNFKKVKINTAVVIAVEGGLIEITSNNIIIENTTIVE